VTRSYAKKQTHAKKKIIIFSILRSILIIKKFWEELITYFTFIQGPHRKRRVQQFFYCCVCIRCGGNFFFTEPLPSNDRGYTCRHTDCWEGFMKCDADMDSEALQSTPVQPTQRYWGGGFTDSMDFA
jgi:hypothetical protein